MLYTVEIKNLVKFYPYESVHASNCSIIIEDKNLEWFTAMCNLLLKYEPVLFVGCPENYFRLEMDNKVTFELENPWNGRPMFVTYWDRRIFISDEIIKIRKMMFCIIREKIKN